MDQGAQSECQRMTLKHGKKIDCKKSIYDEEAIDPCSGSIAKE